MGSVETSCSVDGSTIGPSTVEINVVVLRKLERDLPCDQALSVLGTQKYSDYRAICPSVFMDAPVLTPRTRTQLRYPSTDKGSMPVSENGMDVIETTNSFWLI